MTDTWRETQQTQEEGTLLSVFLGQLNWSPERLAREINKAAGSGTISLKAPYGWLKGSYPRGEIPRIVGQVLSAHLGQRISPATIWPGRFAAGRSGGPGAETPGTAAGAPEAADGADGMDGGERELWAELEEILPLHRDSVLSAAVDWLTDEGPRLRARTEGLPAGSELVAAVGDRIQQLRTLDEAQGGPAVLDWMVHDLRWIARLLRTCAHDRDQALRLHRDIAELAQLAGWLATDLGRDAAARRYYLLGLRAATVAGDRPLGAYILSCLGYQAMWNGQDRPALQLVRIARKGLGDRADRRLRALLASREARVHAKLGDEWAFHHAAFEATELCVLPAAPAEPSWAGWVSPAVLIADAGRAWLDLAQPERAENDLSRGLELLGEQQPRDRLLHSISLASARLARGEADGAADAVRGGLALRPQLQSERVRTRLARVREEFAACDAAPTRSAVLEIEDVLNMNYPVALTI
ncbi:ATP-binding protein [Streptomyces litchfieldiae]|uniref:Transcriptional regulator n=1 Tax=Streptomyces litchfieldiae TaxID=3075543 RepID=A0ABU2MZV1_9ACTN|nr:hypothetical protein [Streptomyces sp. DSM 44938]MDT0346887.1 hypothetical protein [Streptomyces sp. DSM 44938]